MVETKLLSCDGYLLKQLALAGLMWLDTNQEKVNQLNVFPVPDGDTGTNMFLTMRKACEREPLTSARRRRSTSIAAEASE